MATKRCSHELGHKHVATLPSSLRMVALEELAKFGVFSTVYGVEFRFCHLRTVDSPVQRQA
jgi:hypothetical protein